MKLLSLETSTEACSAALLIDGEISERYQLAPQQHNKLILPMIESLLDEAGLSLKQLDALAFGRGPGSFTGVRIAAGVVQGFRAPASCKASRRRLKDWKSTYHSRPAAPATSRAPR